MDTASGRVPSEPGSREPSPSVLALTGFDPSRIAEAVERVDPTVFAPLIRKAADDFYEHVMEAAQDYLRDNMDGNLRSHLDMLESENARMRRELWEMDEIIGPWKTHPQRMKRLLELDHAFGELVTLKYQMAFKRDSDGSPEGGNAAGGAVHDSAGPKDIAQ